MLLPSKIVLHCSATRDSGTKSWSAIKNYHIGVRGWDDIGYHYGIEIVGGSVMVYRGRPWWEKGAHCRAEGRNHDALGVCVVGKFDDAAPRVEIYDATINVLKTLCSVFWIDWDDVYGHSEFEPGKTCPGVKWDMDKVREDLSCLVPKAGSEHGIKIGALR